MSIYTEFYLIDADVADRAVLRSVDDMSPTLSVEGVLELDWFELAQILEVDTHADECSEEDERAAMRLNRKFAARISELSETELEDLVSDWQDCSDDLMDLDPGYLLEILLGIQSLIRRARTTRKHVVLVG